MEKRFTIENENGLSKNELDKFFKENRNVVVGDFTHTTKLVEIIVYLKDGTKLNLLYGDRIEYIDISSDYIGLGSFLINPICNIIKMVVNFR